MKYRQHNLFQQIAYPEYLLSCVKPARLCKVDTL
jgi:hypothetical protein